MERISIRVVNADNWEDATKISVREDQGNFVPTVVESLAYAYIKPWDEALDPYLVLADGEAIGFFYLSYTPDSTDNYWIGGFQIAQQRQRKGYGRIAMGEIINFVRESHPRCRLISLTVERENAIAQNLYQGLGYVSTERLNQDGEIIYTIQLD